MGDGAKENIIGCSGSRDGAERGHDRVSKSTENAYRSGKSGVKVICGVTLKGYLVLRDKDREACDSIFRKKQKRENAQGRQVQNVAIGKIGRWVNVVGEFFESYCREVGYFVKVRSMAELTPCSQEGFKESWLGKVIIGMLSFK